MILDLLYAGWLSLEDYILAHTLTCLVPAFLLAGAMVTFVNREAILDHLGERANLLKAFALAAAASFLVAACSCTVIPVASGLYFAGAGIGVAFIILWVAPAANVLALVYTGSILGAEMVIVRIIAALLVAFVVGFVMRAAFAHERSATPAMQDDAARVVGENKKIIAGKNLGLIGLILLSLLAPNYLVQEGPYLHKIYVWGAGTLLVIGYALKFIARDLIETWLR